MPVERHTVDGAAQFDPALPSGVWAFNRFSNLPRSHGIVIGLVAYFEPEDGVVPTVDVEVWARLAGGAPEDRIPIGLGQASVAMINPVTGNAELRLCGIELPREPGDGGQFWDVIVETTGKLETAVATVQYRITPGPETATHDSTEQ